MSDTGATNLLSVNALQVSFAGSNGQLPAVKGVSFTLAAQQTLALVGESGSGKSVTATAILRLLPKTARIDAGSRIDFMDRNLLTLNATELRALRGKDISMVFQDPMSSLNPVFTVGAQIAESLQLHMGMNNRQALSRAVELLNEVGIPRPELRVNAYPHELSGGQQQRVMIALAIACQPKLLIADELTTALDVTVQKQILELLLRLREQQGMAMLFITHDLGLVREVADHVVVMQQGEIREQNVTAALFAGPQHPYTRALMACRPRLDRRPRRLPVVEDFLDGNAVTESEQRQRGTSPQDAIVLEVKALQKTFTLKTGLFKRDHIVAVSDVSFQLPRGKTLGIVGESGSGKSTAALTLLRLLDSSGGQVWFDGKDLLTLSEAEMHGYRRRIQIVFQNPYASLNPRFTVAQLLLEPMQIHRIGKSTTERLQLAIAMLQRVGLPEAALQRYPHEFSGGQRQRIAIARCLVVRPEVLILDEAVSALDVSVQAQVLNLLQDLQDEFGLSYIFISHDLSVVKHISDRVLVMQYGRVVEMADADELYRAPQTEYTRSLLAAIPGR
ncbi:MAG: ABC transporter ATP-binding protein [Steroidobacteraceae bacterium]